MKITFDSQTIELTPAGSGTSFHALIGDKDVEVEILRSEDGRLDLLIDGVRITAYISSDNANRWVTINGRTVLLTKQSSSRKGGAKHDHSGDMTAPMPGQVRVVHVSEGESVAKGQTLMVLEAMKMEIRIQSPSDGTVSRLFVKQGETVEREQLLITVT